MTETGLRQIERAETGFRGVHPSELDEFWPLAEPLLQRGLRHGSGYRWTLPALRESIAESRRYLWVTWPGAECAVITQFEDYPAAKVLQILWVCGRLPKNWKEIVAKLGSWAKENGCTEIETGGRFGWERLLAGAGFSAVPWVILRKEL